MTENESTPAFEALLLQLQRNRGFDFLSYKRTSLMRRVRKAMDAVSVERFEDYAEYLQVHPEEYARLFNTILINVTEFFRDAEAWKSLAKHVIPAILGQHPPPSPIRIWCPGVASGEEAYTIAILFSEAMGIDDFRSRARIYATDVDESAIEQARQARYPRAALGTLPSGMLAKYFQPQGDTFVFRHDMRRCTIVGRHDLIQDPPISRLDLLVCRNTLMYMNTETQKRILNRFHFAVNNRGFLFLGTAEMLLTDSSMFSAVDLPHRIFAKIPKPIARE